MIFVCLFHFHFHPPKIIYFGSQKEGIFILDDFCRTVKGGWPVHNQLRSKGWDVPYVLGVSQASICVLYLSHLFLFLTMTHHKTNA